MFGFDFSAVVAWATTQLKDNQFLIGILVPFALGVVGYLGRSIPYTIYNYIKRILTLDFVITTSIQNYDEVLGFLYRYRWPSLSRSYAVSRSGTFLTPGYGWSIGSYKGVLFTFNRRILESKNKIEEETSIRFFTRNLDFISELLSNVNDDMDNSVIDVAESRQDWWSTAVPKPKRSLNSVFVNNNLDRKVVQSVRSFVDNEKWYLDRGVPYKKCFLFHGEPGTGKTSLIHGVASELDMDIRVLTSLTTVSSLLSDSGDHWVPPSTAAKKKTSKVRKKIYVIEDIDCLATLKRDDDEDDEQKPAKKSPIIVSQSSKSLSSFDTVLHQLLNTLDGFATPHGLIVFITTNHIEKLDPALLRKGRIDETIELTALDFETMSRMFESFYDRKPEIDQSSYKPRPGAVLQSIFMNNSASDAENELRIPPIKLLAAE